MFLKKMFSKKFTENIETTVTTLFSEGLNFYQEHKYNLAKQKFQFALQYLPNFTGQVGELTRESVLLHIGLCESFDRDYSASHKIFTQVLDNNPYHLLALKERGIASQAFVDTVILRNGIQDFYTYQQIAPATLEIYRYRIQSYVRLNLFTILYPEEYNNVLTDLNFLQGEGYEYLFGEYKGIHYYFMAQAYLSLQNYPNAQHFFNYGLINCPGYGWDDEGARLGLTTANIALKIDESGGIQKLQQVIDHPNFYRFEQLIQLGLACLYANDEALLPYTKTLKNILKERKTRVKLSEADHFYWENFIEKYHKRNSLNYYLFQHIHVNKLKENKLTDVSISIRHSNS